MALSLSHCHMHPCLLPEREINPVLSSPPGLMHSADSPLVESGTHPHPSLCIVLCSHFLWFVPSTVDPTPSAKLPTAEHDQTPLDSKPRAGAFLIINLLYWECSCLLVCLLACFNLDVLKKKEATAFAGKWIKLNIITWSQAALKKTDKITCVLS